VQGGPSAPPPSRTHPVPLASRGKLHPTVGTPTGGVGAGGYNFPREARFHFAIFHVKRGERGGCGRGAEGPPCTPPPCVCVSAIGMTDILT